MPCIIITGASDGIGAEIARQLARTHHEQLQLVLAARDAAKLEAVALECRAAKAQVLVVRTDVAEQAQCRALIAQTVQAFGGIDCLINNAGISAHAMLADVSAEHLQWYEQLMRVNLWGSVWCTHAALPHLQASRGRIVAVSSLAGLVGVPGRTAYSASKFAMVGFFEALRAELKPSGVSGLKEDNAMSVAQCAHLIIRGMHARQREVVMTAKGKLGRWIKLIAPGWVENMALAAVKDDSKPH